MEDSTQVRVFKQLFLRCVALTCTKLNPPASYPLVQVVQISALSGQVFKVVDCFPLSLLFLPEAPVATAVALLVYVCRTCFIPFVILVAVMWLTFSKTILSWCGTVYL